MLLREEYTMELKSICWVLLLLCSAQQIVFGHTRKLVDLSHAFNSRTIRWPTVKPFELIVRANESLGDDGWLFYNDLYFCEHTGTHFDAPKHFAFGEKHFDAATIPIERLVVPMNIINMEHKVKDNRDYEVTENDIKDWEKKYWKIESGTVVIFDFGWTKYWPDYAKVFGTANIADNTTYHFPGLGLDGAKLLVERGIYGIGSTTPSIDHGQSTTFPIHIYLQAQNIYLLENVGDLSTLPDGGKDVTLIVGAMKIDGGSGGPARLIAMYDDHDDGTSTANERIPGYLPLAILLFVKMVLH